jgi:hypothetical protein
MPAYVVQTPAVSGATLVGGADVQIVFAADALSVVPPADAAVIPIVALTAKEC